jgi:tetratricopeptide (TPR) repeat protein
LGKKKRRKRQPRQQNKLPQLWETAKLPLLLIAIAFLPRLLVLLQLSDSPIFLQPVIDADTYHQRAREIAAGDLSGYRAFWQAPLYPYFLGLIYWLFGAKIVIAKLIQIVIGAVSCYLVFHLADRIFGRPVAWIAFGVATLFGPFIFFETQLLAPVLLNFLTLMILILLINYLHSPKLYLLLIAGMLLGLAQIGHGLILTFLPVALAWAYWWQRRRNRPAATAFRAPLVLLVGYLPFIVLTAAHNYAEDGDFVPVSANFGANFYLGNHPNYDSTIAIRPGLEWDEFIQQATIAGHTSPAEQSAYFSGKAMDFIVSDPASFIGLLGKKLYLLTAGEEIKRNLDIYHFRGYSLILKLLIWERGLAFPTGLILPAALGWLLLFAIGRAADSTRADKWLLILFLLSQAVAILLFFVSSRYRLIMMPVTIIFAAAFCWRIVESIRTSHWRLLGVSLTAFLIFLVFCNLPRLEPGPHEEAENKFYEGLALAKAGKSQQAVAKLRDAVALQPNYAMAEYNLALNLMSNNKRNEALNLIENMVRKNRDSFMAHLVAGKGYQDWGMDQRAESLFVAAAQLNPHSTEAFVNLGHIYRERGDTAQALAYLRQAIEREPMAYKAYNQIGAVYMERGLFAQAAVNFKKAYELNGSYVSAINNLATLVGRQSRLDEAAAYLERAYKLDPNDVTVVLNLGALRLRQRDPAAALEFFDQAVELAPSMPQVHHYRGVALSSLRRTGEAIDAFEQALRLNPGFTPAREELRKLRP